MLPRHMMKEAAVAHDLASRIGVGFACLAFALIARADADPVWQPTFADEFDGTAVDWTRWRSIYSDEEPIIHNNELQAYVPEACTVSGGLLHITATKQPTQYGSFLMDYASGALSTGTYFQQLYGKFEMRARLPVGQGLFPAFWMVSSDAPQSEIDTMEALGQEANKVYFNVHGNTPAGPIDEQGNYTDAAFSITDFHTYTVVWEPGLITWSVDGVARFQSEMALDVPMHLLVNLAVGGDWPESPDQTTVFPATFDIDYVRAWHVPEPATLSLWCLGALGLTRRFRK